MQTELVLAVTERLQLARKKAGLDQSELAEILGVTRPTISDYENGRSEPTLSKLVKWAELADVSLDWMCARRDSNPQPSDWGSGAGTKPIPTCWWCQSSKHDTDDCPLAPDDVIDLELQLLALA